VKKIALVDYGLGNLRSAFNAFRCFDIDLIVAERGTELADAAGIVVPGVGSFDSGIEGLASRGHVETISRRVTEAGVAYFGICLGLQFVFEGSEEGARPGFGWFDGVVRRFPEGPTCPKIPHIGWSEIQTPRATRLLAGIAAPADFYFVHSYFVPLQGQAEEHIAATAEYGVTYVAGIERDNIYAVQFHPEKSQLAGMKLIENFIAAA
jgi:imidazole glycerol-phosphate synthase subunit HisH